MAARLTQYSAVESMNWHSTATHYLWLAPAVIQFAVAGCMFVRKLHRKFPIFFTYCLFRSLTALIMFGLDHVAISETFFTYAYWVHQTGCIVLRFSIIYELFALVMKDYRILKHHGMLLLRWGTAGLFLSAVLVVFYAGSGQYATRLYMGLHIVDQAADVVQLGLLVLLFLGIASLSLSLRTFVFGVALGLGIFSAVDLVTTAIETHMSTLPAVSQNQLMGTINLASMSVYHLCVVIWLVYALMPERARQFKVALPAHDMDSWSDELQRLLQR